jgi:hypothetical protein
MPPPTWQQHAASVARAVVDPDHGMGQPVVLTGVHGSVVLNAAIIDSNEPQLIDGQITIAADLTRALIAAESLERPPERGDRVQTNDGRLYSVDQTPLLNAGLWGLTLRREDTAS